VEVFSVGVKDFLNLIVVVFDTIAEFELSIKVETFENLKTPSNTDKLFWL